MSSRTAFPPMRVHKTKRISTKDAQPIIAAYIERSKKKPYLHPDSWLAIDGIRFGPKGGPQGGWAIHHLKRIEAGLRGESLMPETKEELAARFGEEETATHVTSATNPSDDTQLNEAIEVTNGTIDKAARKAAKKARQKEEQKEGRDDRKRLKKNHEIDAWADGSAAAGASDNEARSGYATPYQDSLAAYEERRDPTELDEDPDVQLHEEHAQDQKILEGEIGERDGASVSKQDGKVPTRVKRQNDGDVEVPKKARTAEEKAAKRLAKNAKKVEEKSVKAKGQVPQSGKVLENSEGQAQNGGAHTSGPRVYNYRPLPLMEAPGEGVLCGTEGCASKAEKQTRNGRFVCSRHWTALRFALPGPTGPCEVQGCYEPAKHRTPDGMELCVGHHHRKTYTGSLLDSRGNLQINYKLGRPRKNP